MERLKISVRLITGLLCIHLIHLIHLIKQAMNESLLVVFHFVGAKRLVTEKGLHTKCVLVQLETRYDV